MAADAEGFLRPQVDTERCVACGACQEVCPVLHPAAYDNDTVAYAAIHKNSAIRMESTSGGVFSVLCQWVFDHGGVVFGAAYADDFSVEHRYIQSMDELSTLRTAKYAQSQIGDSLQRVKKFLADGRYVLFSGTPCQTGGLRAFLRRDYEKLILVDLICHGVPSPAVWSKYIDYRSKTDASGAAPESINLRDKETGWPGYSARFIYENGVSYSARNTEDPYLRCFVGNLCLRPACYDCRFKGGSRCSDFTLGDYWGVWNQFPEYDDGKGTSLVLLHSERARSLWQEFGTQMRSCQIPLPECLNENPSALVSPALPEKRSSFMERYKNEDFKRLVQELLPQTNVKTGRLTFLHRVSEKLKRFSGP